MFGRSSLSTLSSSPSLDHEVVKTQRLSYDKRVLFETCVISPSIVEHRAVRLSSSSPLPQEASTGEKHKKKALSSANEKQLFTPIDYKVGLDMYDLRVLWLACVLSVLLLLSLLVFWRSKLSLRAILVCSSFPLAFYAFLVLPFIVVEESIMIIQSLGIQVKKKYFFGNTELRFIEKDKLTSVFVHEYIFRSSVSFCLAWIVEGDDLLLLLFRHVYPGFEAIRNVYQSCAKELQ